MKIKIKNTENGKIKIHMGQIPTSDDVAQEHAVTQIFACSPWDDEASHGALGGKESPGWCED